jgi:hypothetical protein
MEVSLQTRRKGIESKIPDIAETLKVVKFLEARRVGPPYGMEECLSRNHINHFPAPS